MIKLTGLQLSSLSWWFSVKVLRPTPFTFLRMPFCFEVLSQESFASLIFTFPKAKSPSHPPWPTGIVTLIMFPFPQRRSGTVQTSCWIASSSFTSMTRSQNLPTPQLSASINEFLSFRSVPLPLPPQIKPPWQILSASASPLLSSLQVGLCGDKRVLTHSLSPHPEKLFLKNFFAHRP